MNTFPFEIITPEKIVFKDEIEEVSVPTDTGQISILPHHMDILSKIKPGEIMIKVKEKTTPLAITGGFLEVASNHVTILADYAVKAEDIQIAKAEEAKKRAEKLMSEKMDEKDFRVAEFELRKALLELQVGNKHRRRFTSQ